MDSGGKIVSRFYVIYGDGLPIYVGYTNRTVKQRFKEHQYDKDFSEFDNVEVKEVGLLSFDFTWNMDIVDKNAQQVSLYESELIEQYGTQGSRYQRGLGNLLGGQTWASVKGFVHSNKDNPKYRDMDSQVLLEYLDSYRTQVNKLHNFIIHYKDLRVQKLSNFISHYKDPRMQKLFNFISNYKDPRLSKLSHFVKNYRDPRVDKLSHFISHYQDPRLDKLSSFVSNYRDYRLTKLANFIGRYKIKG